jgi:predicted NBD/HSP70 family sugar kinase
MSPTTYRAAPTGTEQQAKLIVELIAHGEAASRSEISRILGLAPSTVSLRVAELERSGVLIEEGVGVSSGGRRPRILRLRAGHDYALVADLGGGHARIGRVSFSGELLETQTVPVRISDGPQATLEIVAAAMRALGGESGADSGRVRGVGMALPGPVDEAIGGVELPSRMPGWQSFAVRDWLEQNFEVPAVVDNDANLMALGEHYAQLGPSHHSITVKAGTAIGSGIIVSGALHRGATGAAGDVTHTRISGATEPCSCGNVGC